MKNPHDLYNSIRLHPLRPEITQRNAVPGIRVFRCDECGRSWQEESRDCLSPSGEHCGCGEFERPYMHFKSMVLMHHDRFSVELCRAHPRKIFVFGDNLQRRGKGGQAIIRDEPNAFGIATKIAPLMSPPAFFDDNDQYLSVVADDIFKIKAAYHKFDSPHTAIVFPTMGLGTGLAKLQEKSPSMWDGLGWLLYQYFGYINGRHSE